MAEVPKNRGDYIFRIKQCEGDSSMVLRTHIAFTFSAQQSMEDCLSLKAKALYSFRNYTPNSSVIPHKTSILSNTAVTTRNPLLYCNSQ